MLKSIDLVRIEEASLEICQGAKTKNVWCMWIDGGCIFTYTFTLFGFLIWRE